MEKNPLSISYSVLVGPASLLIYSSESKPREIFFRERREVMSSDHLSVAAIAPAAAPSGHSAAVDWRHRIRATTDRQKHNP